MTGRGVRRREYRGAERAACRLQGVAYGSGLLGTGPSGPRRHERTHPAIRSPWPPSRPPARPAGPSGGAAGHGGQIGLETLKLFVAEGGLAMGDPGLLQPPVAVAPGLQREPLPVPDRVEIPGLADPDFPGGHAGQREDPCRARQSRAAALRAALSMSRLPAPCRQPARRRAEVSASISPRCASSMAPISVRSVDSIEMPSITIS